MGCHIYSCIEKLKYDISTYSEQNESSYSFASNYLWKCIVCNYQNDVFIEVCDNCSKMRNIK